MAELGRLTAVFDADTRKFDAGIAGVGAKVVALDSTFRGLTGGVTSATSTLSGFAGPAAIAAGAAVFLASAVGSAVVGLFDLVKSSAKAGGELLDLSQKTSFTVETLSGLSIIAKTTGSSIEAISTSLIIFQKNMGAAQDTTSKQGELFKSLNIDTRDNEKALRQAFTVLAKYGETQKAVEVSTKLFGRSGAAVLAMVKETNGNLDVAIKKYGDLGLIISTGAATASDKFNDLLQVTTLQLEAVTRSIGTQLLPVAIDALESISAGLKQNKDAWASWGDSIANVLRGLSVVVHSEIGSWIGAIADFSVRWLTIPGLVARGLGALGSSADRPSADPFGPGGAARGGRGALPGTPEYQAAQARLAAMAGSARTGGGSGGGGGGGGSSAADKAAETAKRIAATELRIVVEGLTAEEQSVERSYDKRRITIETYQRAITGLEKNHHESVVEGLDAEEAAANKITDASKRKIALADIELKRAEEANRHREREYQLEDKILGITRERFALSDRMATRERITDLDRLGAAGATRERIVGLTATGASRERVATTEETVIRERIAMIRDQMRNLSFELTDIFSNSIEDGFNKGIKSGLQTLSLGLLRIVEDVFLKRMAEGLSQMLGNIATGSGGGFFSGLLRSVLGGIAGGATGGIGAGSVGGAGSALAGAFTGLHAGGGYIGPGQWGIVGDQGPEYAFGGKTGMSIHPQGGGQVVNHYTIQLPPAPKGSYVSPKSARQQAELIMAHLQGSQS